MADGCPVCNAPLREDPTCYRCKADLTVLFEVHGAARRLLANARRAYREGSLAEALTLTRNAQALCRTGEGGELEILLLFRTGSPDEAYRRWNRTRSA